MVDRWDGLTFHSAKGSSFLRHLSQGGRQIRKDSIGWIFRHIFRSSFVRHSPLGWKRIQKNSVWCLSHLSYYTLSSSFPTFSGWETNPKELAGWLLSHTLRCLLNEPVNGLKRCQFHTPKRWLVSRPITPHLLSGVFLDMIWSGSWS